MTTFSATPAGERVSGAVVRWRDGAFWPASEQGTRALHAELQCCGPISQIVAHPDYEQRTERRDVACAPLATRRKAVLDFAPIRPRNITVRGSIL